MEIKLIRTPDNKSVVKFSQVGRKIEQTVTVVWTNNPINIVFLVFNHTTVTKSVYPISNIKKPMNSKLNGLYNGFSIRK